MKQIGKKRRKIEINKVPLKPTEMPISIPKPQEIGVREPEYVPLIPQEKPQINIGG
jgi:hypothetical protein